MRRALLIALAAVAQAMAADAPPAWLSQAAATETPAYESDVDMVVLLDEESVTVDAYGVVTTTERKALKILTRRGKAWAQASVIYRTDTGKVRDLNAWLIYPSGKSESFGKKETVDASLASNDVYNEARRKSIFASDEADPGAVFGYEAVTQDKSVFTQFLFQFQGANPALESRFQVTLPAGWTAEGVTFNTDAIEPRVEGSTYTWELRDLKPIEREVAGPPISAIAPRVAVSYYPTEAASAGPAFEQWEDVSAWLATLSDPQSVADDAIRAKALELTAGVEDELGKIAALGKYAQDVRYVSIQTGVGRGGGYRPHAAADVFSNSYGDCKDKANLLRAMLREVGIDSYPVAVYSGDRRFVRPEWASPQQFNHAILAVRVSGTTDAPAVTDVDGLGRLLFFDPTDPYTPVGAIPEIEQDSWALVVKPAGGKLVKLPSVEPRENLLERTIEVELAESGGISAHIREVATGDSAVTNRAYWKSGTESEYRELIERWVTRGVPGSSVSDIAVADERETFELDVTLAAESYGQAMGGRLLVFKPAIVSRRNYMSFSEEERVHPVQLYSNAFDETVRVALPAGFAVDEKPEAVDVETEFGRYQARWEEQEGTLVFSRSLETRNAVVPVEGYGEVRRFYGAILQAEQAPVVLMRR